MRSIESNLKRIADVLGAMYDTVGEDAESRIFKALSAAEYYSTSVARPFSVISTNNIFVD